MLPSTRPHREKNLAGFNSTPCSACRRVTGERQGLIPSWIAFRRELNEAEQATARNLGVSHWRNPMDVRNLLDDTRVWLEAGIDSPQDAAVRFHHRLVSIHPFPNANGRHSRMMADLIAARLEGKSLS